MNKAKIKIKTKVAGVDSMEFLTLGNYEINNGKIEIYYDESEVTGLDETKTKLLVLEDRVEVHRNGNYNSRLVYTTVEDYISLYQTPYGSLKIKVITKKLEIDKVLISESELLKAYIDVIYCTEIEGEMQEETSMSIEIKACL